jgi:hypothetical protein
MARVKPVISNGKGSRTCLSASGNGEHPTAKKNAQQPSKRQRSRRMDTAIIQVLDVRRERLRRISSGLRLWLKAVKSFAACLPAGRLNLRFGRSSWLPALRSEVSLREVVLDVHPSPLDISMRLPWSYLFIALALYVMLARASYPHDGNSKPRKQTSRIIS